MEPPQSPGTPSGGPDWGKITKATGADRLILAGGVLLVIFLFLPWFTYKAGILGNISANGIHEFDGILALLLGIAVTIFAVIRTLGVNFNVGTMKDEMLYLGLGGGAALFAIIRFLRKPGGLSWGFGAYLGIVAAIVLAVGVAQKNMKKA